MFDESLLKSFFSLIALVGVLGIALFIVEKNWTGPGLAPFTESVNLFGGIK